MNHRMRPMLPVLLLLALPAHANLTVHPMRTAVDGRRDTQIRVYSQSAQPQYVQASLRQIVDPAGEGEHEAEVSPDQAAIAITPGKFALSGGGNRLIRVIPLQPVTQETAYRVYFEGVPGNEESETDPVEGAQAKIGLSLIWGALVNVLPADGVVEVQLEDDHLRNTGTLRLGIISIADCQDTRCVAHEVSRSLYPGSRLHLPFPPVAGHTVQLRYRLSRDGYREHLTTLSL